MRPAAALLACMLAFASPAAAAERDVEYRAGVSLPLTGAGISAAVVSELLKPALAPDSCRWCDRTSEGNEGLNGLDASVRRNLRWRDPGHADDLSDHLLYLILPIGMSVTGWLVARHDDRESGAMRDGMIVTEAVVLTALATQSVKYLAGRQRPCAHFGRNCGYMRPFDENLSFFSGHSALSFSLATAAGTVSSMRGYRLQGVVWATGLTLAAATSYLRIAADRHYLTDVLTGAAVGTALGIAVPRLFHESDSGGAEGGPLSGAIVVVGWRF